MNQAGARFLAASEIWLAAHAEAAAGAPPETEVMVAMAPLAETAVAHMDAPDLARFVRWKKGLPKGATDDQQGVRE